MRKLLYFLITLLTINACFAVTSSVKIIKGSAFPGEVLEYVITFSNNDLVSSEVNIQSFLLQKVFNTTVTITPSINLVIPSGESRSVNVSIPVNLATEAGFYVNPLYVAYSGANNVTKREFLEAVVLSNVVELQNLTIVSPASILPYNGFNTSILVFCNVEELHPVVRLIISNDDFVVYESSSVLDLVRGGNIIEKQIKLPNNTKPGLYKLVVQAELLSNIVSQGVSDLVVSGFSLINASIIKDEDLFGKVVTKDFVNFGNEPINVSVNYSFSVLEPLLISKALILVSKEGVVINSITPVINDLFTNTIVTLEPNESAELILSFNYYSLIVAPFVLIISFIAWFYVTKRVIVRKEIIECKREGNELMIKVGISVRNVSTKSVNEVKVIEDLPVYANKAGGFGSLKGDIDKEKGIMAFSLGRLDSREEVLITYKIKTDVELEGRINLPPATVKYTVKEKVLVIKSNTPAIQLIKQ